MISILGRSTPQTNKAQTPKQHKGVQIWGPGIGFYSPSSIGEMEQLVTTNSFQASGFGM